MTRRAFSLAEMMVAIGILGIGLTMVACFFPVAMYQHADTMAQQRAMEVAVEARNLILQIGPDPQNALPWLGLAQGHPQAMDLAKVFHPRAGWRNVVQPPMNPYGGLPPLHLGAPNPLFDEQQRYIWYPFAYRPDSTDHLGTVRYVVVVTRRLPGQRFPNGWNIDESMRVFPQPVYFHDTMANPGEPGHLQVVSPRELRPQNPALPNDWSLIDVTPPGSKIISLFTWNVYTVLSAAATDRNQIALREQLHTLDFGSGPGQLTPFVVFPPPVEGGVPGGESPLVMVLSF